MTTVKTILFVENDLVSQTMYQKRLEREGYHVECARDGQVALDILSERAPDLVLLDLMLPKVSGADVLKFMQADPRLTTVPVIIFSNAPLTEVPPDSALAQGTKRLLKSDCTFPTLLAAIEETLANAPEFVVMEAGGNGSAASTAMGNSAAQPRDSAPVGIPELEPEPSSPKKGSEFLKEAASMMLKIREHSMGYIKAPGSESSQSHLAGLHQRIHLLNTSVAQSDCPRLALLTNAFVSLLQLVMDKPSTVTPSVLQTIAQAVDCLDGLLKNKDDYCLGPAFKARILVVDDDTVCNHVNVTSLKRANFDPIGVKDPAAALEMLETTPFDLVVLDVNMPGMTGFDVCTSMRRLPHCKKTPVIFVTAFSNFDNRKQSVLSGGNDFVSKPVTPSELALKVTVNLIKARVQGTPMPLADAHAGHNGNGNGNGSTVPFPSGPSRLNEPATAESNTSAGTNRLAAGPGPGIRDSNVGAPLRMSKSGLENHPNVPEHPLPPKPTSPVLPGKPEKPATDIHERLRQSTAALEHAKAGLDRESAERSRIESQWREQLSSAEGLLKQSEAVLKEKEARCVQLEKELTTLQQTIAQKETVLKDKDARCIQFEKEIGGLKQTAAQKDSVLKEREERCGQLEKELAGAQRTREELQTKFAAEQQAASKAQHELQDRFARTTTELERSRASLKQQSEERSRLEEEWRERFSAAKTAVAQLEKEIATLQETAAQKENVLKEKENRCSQLEKEFAGSQRLREELQGKIAAEQQAASKAQHEFQDRLNRINSELEQAKAGCKQESAKRAQLETESAGLRQSRDELQNKLSLEQQQIAKAQEEMKGFQERLHKTGTELERVRSACEQESAKRAQLESECKNLAQAKEGLASELRHLHDLHAAHETRLKDYHKKLADGLRDNIRLLQLRLQETESFDHNAGGKTQG